MAFPELPDDRRAHPRRYRGSDEDGDPAIPDETGSAGDDEREWLLGAAAQRGRGARVPEEGDGSGRRRAHTEPPPAGPPAREQEPPWPPRGRRRLVSEDDDGRAAEPPRHPTERPDANGDGNGFRANGYAHDGVTGDGPGPHGFRNGTHRNGAGPQDPDARARNGHGRTGAYDGRMRDAHPVAPGRETPPREAGPRPSRHGRVAEGPGAPGGDDQRHPEGRRHPGDGGEWRAPDAPDVDGRRRTQRPGAPVDAPGDGRPPAPVRPRSGPPPNGTGYRLPSAPVPGGAESAPPGRRRRLEPGEPPPEAPPRRDVRAQPPPPRPGDGDPDDGSARRAGPPTRNRRPGAATGGAAAGGAVAGAAPADADDDVETTSLPLVPGPRDRDLPEDPDGPDTTARPRAAGRRARPDARAAPPDAPAEDVEDARSDAPDDPDARDPQRSGPVGIGGRLSAALASRGRDADGKKKPTSFWRELPLLVGVALVLTFLIQTFVAKVFVIPSGSMETTLNGCAGCDNDRVLVDKVTYNFADIAPGDVVVFRGPDSWSNAEYELPQTSNPVWRGLQMAGSLIGFAPPDEKDFVKRVIAVGGQTVACCDALNQVMVDGQPLDEPYVYYLPEAGPARQIPFGPITVPQGEMWMMGDSRNNSADSRAAGHGPVPEENVIGKVRLIVLPFDRFGGVAAVNPQTTATAAGTGDLPHPTALAVGMMGAFPFALGRRRLLHRRAEEERFLPAERRRKRWRPS